MPAAMLPVNEQDRVTALRRLQILDTEAEAAYDELVALAATITGSPIALVSLVDADRQWFKARYGLDAQETPRSMAFCAHAILEPDQPFIIPDATRDPRVSDNPLVTGAPDIRAYAGVPLRVPDLLSQPEEFLDEHATQSGYPVGTLCVICREAREFSESDIASLQTLARQVERLMVLRDVARGIHDRNVELQEATAAKSKFLSTMSHDIRTPINGIIGASALLASEAMTDQQAEHINVIRACSDSLLHLVNNVLDLSKIEFGGMEPRTEAISLPQAIADALRVVQESAQVKGLSLLSQVDDSVPGVVAGDPRFLHKILLNILSNAIKFTNQGSVSLMATYSSGRLKLAVQDSGIGISKDDLARVRHPFVQIASDAPIDRQGSGLGLAIVGELCRTLQGEWSIDSELEKGTLVTVELPMAELSDDSLQDRDVSDQSVPEGLRVAIVDDNDINRKILAKNLERLGCTVLSFSSGHDAVEGYRTGEFCDLVFMDCQMPVMDGFETTRSLRAAGFSHPILALTADVFPATQQQCFESGMQAVLTKPITAEKLQESLLEWTSTSL